MENKFNLKKFLVENKLTSNSRSLREEEDSREVEGYLDAVFDTLNDMMRLGEISEEEFLVAKRKLDNDPKSIMTFKRSGDIQAAVDSLLRRDNKLTSNSIKSEERGTLHVSMGANAEEEQKVIDIAKDAIALMDEQPGTDAISALAAVLESFQ